MIDPAVGHLQVRTGPNSLTRDESEPTMWDYLFLFKRRKKLGNGSETDRRHHRSFAVVICPLEGRTMLSTVATGTVATLTPTVATSSTTATTTATTTTTTTTTVFVGPLPDQTATTSSFQDQASQASVAATWDQDSAHHARLMGFAIVGPPPPGYATPLPPPGHMESSGDVDSDHVAMDVSTLTVNGASTREFAFADQDNGTVIVHNCSGNYTLTGIAQPQAVALKDINGDGIPDLVVADSGNDRVLVFPGQKDGSFGAEVNGGHGFAVGADPVGITVDPVEQNGPEALIVANRGSDNVSILMSQGQGNTWTLNPQILVGDGPGPGLQGLAPGQPSPDPVMAKLWDINGDDKPDLVVLNSGTNNVVVIPGQANGVFDESKALVIPTGLDPTSMFIGRFDKRPGMDLLTVNTGSNNLSFISGISTGQPSTLTITSGGVRPDAAFAVDPDQDPDSVMDLVVANSGDGRVALLQGANVGMQLAGVITRPDLPSPTAISEGSATADGFDIYAATAGQDAAAILHFDLNSISGYLSLPPSSTEPINSGDNELVSQLMAVGDSPGDLVTVLWYGGGSQELLATERGLSSSESYYARTEGQGLEEVATTPTMTSNTTDLTLKAEAQPADRWTWTRFISGLDAALTRTQNAIEAVTDFDAREFQSDRAYRNLARNWPSAIDPDLEVEDLAVKAALQSLRSDEQGSDFASPPIPFDLELPEAPPTPELVPTVEGPAELPGVEVRSNVVPLVSSVLLASRLILKVSPPRPSTFRQGSRRRTIVTRPGAGGPPFV